MRVYDAFMSRFKSNKMIHVEGWETHFLCLDSRKAYLWEVLFTTEKIRGELMGDDRNKAPDLEGFIF